MPGIGEAVILHEALTGVFVPIVLLKVKEISLGSKLAYARLLMYAGTNGEAYPKLETLADELGVSSRQVSTYISELKEFGLIDTVRPGMGEPNHYLFLWHPLLEESLRRNKTSDQLRKFSSYTDRKRTSNQDQQKTSPAGGSSPYCIKETHEAEENQAEETQPPLAHKSRTSLNSSSEDSGSPKNPAVDNAGSSEYTQAPSATIADFKGFVNSISRRYKVKPPSSGQRGQIDNALDEHSVSPPALESLLERIAASGKWAKSVFPVNYVVAAIRGASKDESSGNATRHAPASGSPPSRDYAAIWNERVPAADKAGNIQRIDPELEAVFDELCTAVQAELVRSPQKRGWLCLGTLMKTTQGNADPNWKRFLGEQRSKNNAPTDYAEVQRKTREIAAKLCGIELEEE